ncbi:MAG TPA: DUF501 domain-containing protein [Acidimicrobiales bacterium]|nr:DUF501 domain-containing protein [Acidimicrobiales bacterium]
MTVAGVVIALDHDAPGRAGGRAGRPRRSGGPVRSSVVAARAALDAGFDEVVVVVVTGDEDAAPRFPDAATVLLDGSVPPSEASAMRAAVDWCARAGHDAVVVALADRSGRGAPPGASEWARVAEARGAPVSLGTRAGRPIGLARLAAEIWPLLPLGGAVDVLWRSRPELAATVSVDGAPGASAPVPTGGPSRPGEPAIAPEAVTAGERATPDDVAAIEELLGRPAGGEFTVVVRSRSGAPVVIENAPLLRDGTPMPTRYWLVGVREREAVGRLEAAGGVRRAEAAVGAGALADAHARYAAERDAALPEGHEGPVPTGGVGGTKTGVKCLHAHLAWYLAGGCDPVGRWVADELAGAIDGPVAAVDCGTNSTRLLVVDATGRSLERLMTITRLGAGVDETGALAPEAIERTLAALRGYRAVMDRHGVVVCRATATSAARDASNADDLLARAASVLGAPLETLSGADEGRLAYRGATAELDASGGPYLVVDLGGGSTELVAGGPGGADESPAAVASLDVGCVRVTERFLASDPATPTEIAAASEHVARLVERALREHPALGDARRMVGVAGTVSTLAVLALGLARYERDAVHHSVLTREAVDRLAAELLAQRAAERTARPGVEPGRADVIAGGALVLAGVMAATGHDELVVSESDILDGIAAELLARG